MDSIKSWVSEHKLTSIGTLWASAVVGSLAYTQARSPLKPGLRIIHARLHAQALTLAVLSGAAFMNYWEVKPPLSARDDENLPSAHFTS